MFSKNRSFRQTMFGGAALALGSVIGMSAAQATVFGGSATFADTGPTNALTVTGTSLVFATKSLTATSRTDCGDAGNCQPFSDFMTLRTTDSQITTSNGQGTTLSDNITLTFKWTSPSPAANSIFNGVVSETVFKTVSHDDGSLTWANDILYDSDSHRHYAEQIVNFDDGAKIAIDLYDASLDPSGSTLGALAGQFDMQICDLKDPTTVPEPMSMAVLGSGLFGLGMIRRRQTKRTV
jgi:hypothetical protein